MRKIAMLSVIALTGCNNALTCNDSDAKSKVLEVIDSNIVDAAWYKKMKPDLGGRRISGISTTSENEKLGQYSCSATYTVEYKGKTRETNFSYDLKYLEDKDESEVLVEVSKVQTAYIMIVSQKE